MFKPYFLKFVFVGLKISRNLLKNLNMGCSFICGCDSYLNLQGILLKGGHVLDALASCHTIAFDKTGTLTTGGLVFKAIEPVYGHRIRNKESNISSCCIPTCEKEALAVAAAMEKGTTHPIGRYHFEQIIFVLLLNQPRTSNNCGCQWLFASFIYLLRKSRSVFSFFRVFFNLILDCCGEH